jgi:hypothetical protein
MSSTSTRATFLGNLVRSSTHGVVRFVDTIYVLGDCTGTVGEDHCSAAEDQCLSDDARRSQLGPECTQCLLQLFPQGQIWPAAQHRPGRFLSGLRRISVASQWS